MKLQLDLENKVITVDDTVNFKELLTVVKGILKDWKEWDIQGKDDFYVLPYYPVYDVPYDWGTMPTITCGGDYDIDIDE